ncbi:MAG: ATP-binding protein [Nitrospiraceae bacterium]|nr:ATP-binding protein [Nitrospiraceae bacterium]
MTGATAEAPEILLRHHLKKLKLPTVLREHEKLARNCAAENVDHVRYLARLVELELLDREARMIDRRVKAARFPAVKSLESFDFDALPALNRKLVLDLARCEYVGRCENVVALGPSGVGKTHVALGLGLAACQRGVKTRFATAAAIVHEMIEARDDKRLLRFQKMLAGYELLIIDEFGFDRLERQACPEAPQLLYKVIEGRYGQRTTVLVTNVDFEAWGEYLGDAPLATAFLDRLVDGAIILKIVKARSYRANRARRRNVEVGSNETNA